MSVTKEQLLEYVKKQKAKIKALESQTSELTAQVAQLSPLETQNSVLKQKVAELKAEKEEWETRHLQESDAVPTSPPNTHLDVEHGKGVGDAEQKSKGSDAAIELAKELAAKEKTLVEQQTLVKELQAQVSESLDDLGNSQQNLERQEKLVKERTQQLKQLLTKFKKSEEERKGLEVTLKSTEKRKLELEEYVKETERIKSELVPSLQGSCR